MISESFAILVVFVLLLVSFMRSKFADVTPIVLPVMVIPGMYILTRGVLFASKGRMFGVRPEIVLAFSSLLAIALTCALMAYISTRLPSKKTKIVYLGVMGLYAVLLGWAYIFDSLRPVLQQVHF